jgi:uncharacterized damage-inducible protein DinB
MLRVDAFRLTNPLWAFRMVDVRKLIEYNEEVRHRYLDVLAKLPWSEFVKNREASWHSLRNIFIHTLGAADHWLDLLTGEKQIRSGFEYYKTMKDVEDYMNHVEKRMRSYLNSLTHEHLMATFRVTNDAGETVDVTAEDVLIHVFEEEVHHRGELIALLWQMDIEPPLMGWKYL